MLIRESMQSDYDSDMGQESFLDMIAALSSIATAGVALRAYIGFLFDRKKKRAKLLAFLHSEKSKAYAIIEVMAFLKMTESEVMDAAFCSKFITCHSSDPRYPTLPVIYLQFSDRV